MVFVFLLHSASTSGTAADDHSDARARAGRRVAVQRVFVSFYTTSSTMGEFSARGPEMFQTEIGRAHV